MPSEMCGHRAECGLLTPAETDTQQSIHAGHGATFRSGATAWPRIHRMKEKEKRIQTLFDCFNTGGMTLNNYIAAIKHITVPYCLSISSVL